MVNVQYLHDSSLFFLIFLSGYYSDDLGIVAEYTDNMMVMYSGRIVEKGKTPKVFKKLSHPYTRGLFDSMPKFEENIRQSNSKNNESLKKRFSTIPGRVPEFFERSNGCYFKDRCSRTKKNCSEKIPIETNLGGGHSVCCFNPY